MSIIDVCKKVARERNARTVLRFAPKTSHQSNRFCRSSARTHTATRTMLQTQIETNIGVQLSAISLPYHFQFVTLDLFSQDSQCDDGRTPFQDLLETPCVSPLCMFGESVFALIPDHEVRAAKLTNR